MSRPMFCLAVAAAIVPLLATSPAAGEEGPLTATEVVEKVNEANRSLTTWSADFVERHHFVHFDQTDTRLGKIAYAKGIGLRIDILEPNIEMLLVRSDEALQWQPKIKQLNVYKLEPDSVSGDDLPIPLPMGASAWKPEDHYDVSLPSYSGPEILVELVPKSDASGFQKKMIWIDPESWLPVRIQLVEETDDVMHFGFTNIRMNEEIDPSHFQFEAPDGSEVVEHSDLPKF